MVYGSCTTAQLWIAFFQCTSMLLSRATSSSFVMAGLPSKAVCRSLMTCTSSSVSCSPFCRATLVTPTTSSSALLGPSRCFVDLCRAGLLVLAKCDKHTVSGITVTLAPVSIYNFTCLSSTWMPIIHGSPPAVTVPRKMLSSSYWTLFTALDDKHTRW